jgi:hypothetical protein
LVAGPFCSAYDVKDTTVLREMCMEHVKRYIEMLSYSNTLPSKANTTTEITSQMMAARDEVLLTTILQDLKFKFAATLGGDFAPLANELAIAVLGPREIH